MRWVQVAGSHLPFLAALFLVPAWHFRHQLPHCSVLFPGYLHDGTAGMVALWWTLDSLGGAPWSHASTTLVGYPDGIPLWTDESWTTAAVVLPGLLVTKLVGSPVCAYTLMAILGMSLTGLTTYLLGYFLCRNRLLSTIAALIFASSEFVIEKITIHLEYAFWWPLPLLLLLLIEAPNRTVNRLRLLGAIFLGGMAVMSGPYMLPLIGLLILASVSSLFSAQVCSRKVAAQRWAALSGAIIIGTLPVVAMILIGRYGSASGTSRAASDIYEGGASWYQYLPDFTWLHTTNRVFGWLGDLQVSDPNLVDGKLFFGWFALVGMLLLFSLRAMRKVRLPSSTGTLIALIALSLVASISGRIMLGRVDLALPAVAVFEYFPVWRTVVRFGHLAQLPAIALAVVGWQELLRRRGKKVWVLIVVVASLDLIHAYRPAPTLDFRLAPNVYRWLAHQEENQDRRPVIVESRPFGPREWGTWRSWQPIHNSPLANSGGASETALRQEAFDAIDDPQLPCIASSLGASLILFHAQPDSAAKSIPNLTLVRSFRQPDLSQFQPGVDSQMIGLLNQGWFDVDVYRVNPGLASVDALIGFGTGWFPEDSRIWDGQREMRWLVSPRGSLEIERLTNGSTPEYVPISLKVRGVSDGIPLRIIQNDVDLWQGTIPAQWTTVKLIARGTDPIWLIPAGGAKTVVNFAGRDFEKWATIAIGGFGIGQCREF